MKNSKISQKNHFHRVIQDYQNNSESQNVSYRGLPKDIILMIPKIFGQIVF